MDEVSPLREGRTVAARSHSGNRLEGAAMSDKSPRQGMSKKSGKSIKEKRAEKRDKAHVSTLSEKLAVKKK
jgi:hypothetical protein